MSRSFSIQEVQNAGERVSPLAEMNRNFQLHKDIYRFALPYAGASVIDLGCGSGYGAALFSEQTTVRAFDYDENAIEYSRQTFGRANLIFEQADLNQPLDCGTADLIFSSNVFEHLLDVRQGLQTAMSAMRQKATFILAIPCIIESSRFNLELLNPYHFTNFSYPFWQDTLQLCFHSVEPRIQLLLCPVNRFNASPQTYADTLSAFAKLDKTYYGEMHLFPTEYANLVFICRDPKRDAQLADFASCPVSNVRRPVLTTTQAGWQRLERNQSVSCPIPTPGRVGGVQFTVRGDGRASVGWFAATISNGRDARRQLFNLRQVAPHEDTMMYFDFHRYPLECSGATFTVQAVGLVGLDGFSILGTPEPAIRVYETVLPR